MKPFRLHMDAHVHIYPFYDLPRLLLAALDHMPRLAPTDQRALCLAERAGFTFFQALAQDELSLHSEQWRIVAWDPDGGVKIRHVPDHRDLWILSGRQTVTAEHIEICSLFSDRPVPDGQDAESTVRAIQDAGGLPALDWAFGKWLFRRGRLIRSLLQQFPPEELVLIDTAMRPPGWPAPLVYAAARRAGRALLAGTDPLPAEDEEDIAGCYYATLLLPPLDDPARIVAPLRRALQQPGTA
ncbi:MAG: hypothetical protein LBN38_01210, partial [Verrucomicrobiota bacterium]|nr:hypothetical protein [Verrucomicrobiota bacterium]